jgi:hypothetical protein
MKNINALLDEFNIAGLDLILLMPTTLVGVLPYPDLENDGAIDVSAIDVSEPYDKWFMLIHTRDTGILNEDCDPTDDGPVYKYSIECFVPKHYAFRENQFNELAIQEHLVIAKDHNGIFKFMGSVRDQFDKKGFDFKWKYTSGGAAKDRNGYKINLTLTSSEKSRPVSGFDSLPVSSEFHII